MREGPSIARNWSHVYWRKPLAQLIVRHNDFNWALFDQALVSAVNFVVAIFLARRLGLAAFGQFTLAWLIVQFAELVQQATIISPMMSIGPKQPYGNRAAYYGAVFVHQLLLTVPLFLTAYFVVNLLTVLLPHWHLDGLALPVATACISFQFQNVVRKYFFSRGHAARAFLNDAIAYLGLLSLLVFTLLAVSEETNASTVLWINALAFGAAGLIGLSGIRGLVWDSSVFVNTLARHWRFSKWLLASISMQWLSGNTFTLVTGSVLGPPAVGVLKAAQSLMGVTHVLFLGMGNIVPVRAAWYLHHHGSAAMAGYLREIAVFGGLATGVISLIASLAPDYWLWLVFGSGYGEYGFVLRWFAVTYIFIFLSLPAAAGLHALEDTVSVFLSRFCTMVFSVLAAYPLVAGLGLNGAAVGTLVASLLSVSILYLGIRKRRSLEHAKCQTRQ